MANKFEKVSWEQYWKDYKDEFWGVEPATEDFEKEVRHQWENIKLPRRATRGSAGYDFFVPRDVTLDPGQTIKVPTGIKCKMDDGLVLLIFVRSSIGFKYQTVLVNNVAVVDSDYAYAKNSGHIWLKLRNDGAKTLYLEAGDAVAQGIIMKFYTTEDDEVDEIRTGGIGSTSQGEQ